MKSLMDLVSAAKKNIDEIDAGKLKDKISSDSSDNFLLVDIREPAEVADGMIDGAINIPRGVLEPAADLDYPKRHPQLSEARSKNVVLYCASGGRSALAADVLQQMGFENVESLAGGYDKWAK